MLPGINSLKSDYFSQNIKYDKNAQKVVPG